MNRTHRDVQPAPPADIPDAHHIAVTAAGLVSRLQCSGKYRRTNALESLALDKMEHTAGGINLMATRRTCVPGGWNYAWHTYSRPARRHSALADGRKPLNMKSSMPTGARAFGYQSAGCTDLVARHHARGVASVRSRSPTRLAGLPAGGDHRLSARRTWPTLAGSSASSPSTRRRDLADDCGRGAGMARTKYNADLPIYFPPPPLEWATCLIAWLFRLVRGEADQRRAGRVQGQRRIDHRIGRSCRRS